MRKTAGNIRTEGTVTTPAVNDTVGAPVVIRMIGDEENLRPPDTLGIYSGGPTPYGTIAGSHRVTPEEMFGNTSRLNTSMARPEVTRTEVHMYDNAGYKSVVLICLVGYILMAAYFRTFFTYIFGILKNQLQTEKIIEDKSAFFSTYLNLMVVLAGVGSGFVVLRIMAPHIPAAADLQYGWTYPLIISAAVFTVYGYRYLVLQTAGYLTSQSVFTASLLKLRSILTAIVATVGLPVAILSAFTGGMEAGSFYGLTIFILSAGVVMIAIKTFIFFTRQNFSIFFWFLYLCAVEIFPVSLFALLFIKNAL